MSWFDFTLWFTDPPSIFCHINLYFPLYYCRVAFQNTSILQGKNHWQKHLRCLPARIDALLPQEPTCSDDFGFKLVKISCLDSDVKVCFFLFTIWQKGINWWYWTWCIGIVTARLYHLTESQLSSVKSIGTSPQTPHSWRLHRKWPFASNTNCGRCCFLLQKLQGGVIETNSSIWHDQNWILRVKKQETSDFLPFCYILAGKKHVLFQELWSQWTLVFSP